MARKTLREYDTLRTWLVYFMAGSLILIKNSWGFIVFKRMTSTPLSFLGDIKASEKVSFKI